MTAALFAATGCASTGIYTTPTTTAPEVWYIDTGQDPDYSTYVQAEEPRRVGATLFSMASLYPTRGELETDAVWGRHSLPAGTNVYATNYTLSRTWVRAYTGEVLTSRNLNANNNPIEWCAEHQDFEAICIFYRSPDEGFYIEALGNAKEPVIPNLYGEVGTLPEIKLVDPEEGYQGRYDVVFVRGTENSAYLQTRKIRTDDLPEARGLFEVPFPDGAEIGYYQGITPAILRATRNADGFVSSLEVVYPANSENFRQDPEGHWRDVLRAADPEAYPDVIEPDEEDDPVIATSFSLD